MYCAGKKRLFLLGLMFFLIMTVSGIYSLSSEVISGTQSTLSTSYVDLTIDEVNSDGTPYAISNEVVVPGEEILLIPRINNLGAECYLRAKITYAIDGEEYNELDYIDGDYSGWSSDGEYYYYENSVGKNESLNLFDKIHIPDNLDAEKAGTSILVNILVEGVQAKNFESWDDVEILEGVERAYYVDTDGDSTIIYENNADQYIELDDAFFNNLGNMLPGDSTKEQISVENSSKKIMSYYVSIDDSEMTQEEKDLLENIRLIITNGDGEVISDGTLHIKDKLLLGTYYPGESEDLIFEVQLPKNLNNQYSKLYTKLLWNFSLQDEGEPGGANPNTNNEGSNHGNPNTGDFKFDLSITVFLVSALGLAIVLILEKLETEKIEKKLGKKEN